MSQQSSLSCSTLLRSILLAMVLAAASCVVVTGDDVIAPRRGDDVSPPAGDGAEPSSDGGDSSQVDWLPVGKVIDGDTFHVMLDGADERVRLQGLDTPELSTVPPQPYADVARDYTSAHIGTEIALEYDSHCSLGECPPENGTCREGTCCEVFCRLLGYVQLADGADLGAMLLQAGLARTYNYCANAPASDPPVCDGCAYHRVTCEQWEYFAQNPAACADARHTDCGCEDYDRRVEYCALEAQAQADGVGIWSGSP